MMADKEGKDDAMCGPADETFKDKYLYFGISSFDGCSMSLVVQSQPPRGVANKIKLDAYRNKRKELRRNIDDYFTPADPYYRDMLAMVEK